MLGLGLFVALPACAERPVDAERSPIVRASRVDDAALVATARLHPTARLGPAWVLHSSDSRFGGFSGLSLEPDRLLLLSDRGWLWSVERDPSGVAPFREDSWRVRALRVAGRAPDAEDLARTSDGALLVALEGRHAIATLPTDRPLTVLDLDAQPLAEPLASLPANRGVEALAALPGGSILAIAEEGHDDRHTAALLGAGTHRPLAYRSAPGFAPTGADWSEGWLFVLERRVSPFSGFVARVTATPLRDPTNLPDLVEPPLEIARLSGPGAIDNMEAVAAERIGRTGPIRLWLVSDDNFSPLQRTVLILLEWSPQALARASIRRFSRTSSEGSSASDTERR